MALIPQKHGFFCFHFCFRLLPTDRGNPFGRETGLVPCMGRTVFPPEGRSGGDRTRFAPVIAKLRREGGSILLEP